MIANIVVVVAVALMTLLFLAGVLIDLIDRWLEYDDAAATKDLREHMTEQSAIVHPDDDVDHFDFPEPSEAPVMPAEPKSETRTTTDERALIYCITCGTPFADHTEVCSRHAYRPAPVPVPPVPDDIASARQFILDQRAKGRCGSAWWQVGRLLENAGSHQAGAVVIVTNVLADKCCIQQPFTPEEIAAQVAKGSSQVMDSLRVWVPLSIVDRFPAADPFAGVPAANGANGEAR